MGSVTTLLYVPGDDEIELQSILNWFLTISWASYCYVDVFQDTEIQLSGLTTLELDAGELVTPYGATPSTDYWYYTDNFYIASGQALKATFMTDAETFGTARIVMDTTMNSGINWYTWYDTGDIGSGADYPNGYLDRSGLEKVDTTDFIGGSNIQLRVKITTDGAGQGGEVKYIALLTDPDLFA